jgi:hypothetical protein
MSERKWKGSTSMTIFDRFNITVVAAGAGLCGVALAFSPPAAAAPLITGGGYACVQTSSGDAVGAAPAATGAVGAAAAAGACGPASAPLSEMAGVPMALPGPVPVAAPPVPAGVPPVPVGVPPVPVGVPPVPVGVPPVPVGAPVAAPVPVGAPLTAMSGVAGKEQPSGPPPDGAPVSGQPILPGPTG